MNGENEGRPQRVKLRLVYPGVGSAIKLDATVLQMSHDGKEIEVQFDAGTFGRMMLYVYGNTGKLCDKKNCQSATQENARLFEVL